MIILASSSQTRAEILRQNGINFTQLNFNFDESKILKDCSPAAYVWRVALAKKEQILAAKPDITHFLIADSCVACGGKILGKAKDEDEARRMLNLQSGNEVSVYSALIFVSLQLELTNVSKTAFKFAKFDERELEIYLKNGEWRGKAGAMSIEGFNKKYVVSQNGNLSTAMGLNVEILKAFS